MNEQAVNWGQHGAIHSQDFATGVWQGPRRQAVWCADTDKNVFPKVAWQKRRKDGQQLEKREERWWTVQQLQLNVDKVNTNELEQGKYIEKHIYLFAFKQQAFLKQPNKFDIFEIFRNLLWVKMLAINSRGEEDSQASWLFTQP